MIDTQHVWSIQSHRTRSYLSVCLSVCRVELIHCLLYTIGHDGGWADNSGACVEAERQRVGEVKNVKGGKSIRCASGWSSFGAVTHYIVTLRCITSPPTSRGGTVHQHHMQSGTPFLNPQPPTPHRVQNVPASLEHRVFGTTRVLCVARDNSGGYQ